MAKPRVFISSTCYDLDILRGELRPFISSIGYEPVMSEYSDVLFDPRTHTHDSCIKEIPGCDIVILIIGSRFGGKAVPSALQMIDFESVRKKSTATKSFDDLSLLSITQLEVLKAVENSIPVYVFVDDRVMHDHHVYEKNKDKEIIDKIDFPSIQKKDTAKYIFEFMNFLSHRLTGNAIATFSSLDEIKSHLLSQWAQLFQRLLSENKLHSIETRRYRDFSERIEDLKAAIMATIATPNLRDIAKGAIKYRHLMMFLSAIDFKYSAGQNISSLSFDDLIKSCNIINIRQIDSGNPRLRRTIYLLKEDGTFYLCKYPISFIEEMNEQWGEFKCLENNTQRAIFEANVQDDETQRFSPIRHVNSTIDEYVERMERMNPYRGNSVADKEMEIKAEGESLF